MPTKSSVKTSGRIASYRDLLVWQKAMDLTAGVYRLCRRLPKSEAFGLGDQLRRSAISIASNIAEGHQRNHLAEYLHHLSIARGSLAELETQLAIAEAVDYFTERETRPLVESADEIGRMLGGLTKKLAAKSESVRSYAREAPHTSPRT
jgi:four helix bundle protein